MAGHSQFKNIMHRKGKQDKMRSKIFAKLCARNHRRGQGGPARSRMPMPGCASPSRTRAPRTCRRTTSSAPSRRPRAAMAKTIDAVRYEGYGPGGVAVIVEALTDNRNRTARNVRALFTKYGGNMGETGSVRLHVRPGGRDRLSAGQGQRRCDAGGRHRGRRRRRGDPTRTATPSPVPSKHRRGFRQPGKEARRRGKREGRVEAADADAA